MSEALDGGVVRRWEATVARSDLGDWIQTYLDKVLTQVRNVDGFRGVTFLAERERDPCRVSVLTTWDDMGAVTRFAGQEPARAVVPEFMTRFFIESDPEAPFHDVLLQEAN